MKSLVIGTLWFSSLLSPIEATVDTVRGVQERRLDEVVVPLGDASKYVILAKTGISTVPDSTITGDIAVSPIAAGAMTGFSLTLNSAGTFSTSDQVTGNAFASDYTDPTPTALTTAVSDMETAYTNAAGRPNTDAARINLGAGILGGVNEGGPSTPLTTGVYTFSTDVFVTGQIHFSGSATDVFIIQIAGNLIQSANYNVILSGSVKAENIFWQVAGYVEVGSGAHVEGILLVKTGVTFKTSSSLNGRVLAQTACVLQQATITEKPQSAPSE
jgi:hypothetical protein